ncbi:MAG: hypothetical protein Harvfovirus2_21 [Harvfovirus sp.]|uniref:MORN repeat-containing protein n=1 Tax=Harvfovirus sp. TaxID=2487768 RepID=A0A3G5A2S0_9VIRU|nr:MAG: hypothetical protein Harvfovirus2_21 [Harvfovirus sp.]
MNPLKILKNDVLFESFHVNTEGDLDGLFERFHPNGSKWVICHYKKGRKEGPYRRWFANRQPKISCEYKNSLRRGEYSEWDENGDIKERRIYCEGVIVKQRYYIRRMLRRMELNEEYENKIPTGRKIVTIYGEKKERISVGEYAALGVPDGTFTAWSAGVKISESRMVGGKKHGGQYFYHCDGKIYKFEMYENGLRYGPSEEWAANGQNVCKSHYKNGKLHGSYKMWYPYGVMKYHAEYLDGILQGISAFNDGNGRSCIISGLNSTVWQAAYVLDHETKQNKFVHVRFSVPYTAKKMTSYSAEFICRVSAAKVEEIIDLHGNQYKFAKSFVFDDERHIFIVGKIISSDFDEDIGKPDARGFKVHLHRDHCDLWLLKFKEKVEMCVR